MSKAAQSKAYYQWKKTLLLEVDHFNFTKKLH